MNIEELLALGDLLRLALGNVQDWQQLANEPIEQAGGFAWSRHGAAWADGRDVTLVSRGRRCKLQGHGGFVAGLAFSPDGQRLASASHDTTVRLWEVEACAQSAVLTAEPYMVFAVAFSPDGSKLASCGGEGMPVRLWDVATREQISQHTVPGADAFQSVAFAPDGKHLAACELSGQVVLWDLASGDATAVGRHQGMAMAVAVSPDGTHLASAGQDGGVNLWRIPDLSLAHEFDVGEAMFSVAFHPQGGLLVAGDFVGALRAWSLDTRELLRTIQAHSDLISAASFNPQGTLLASVSIDHSIAVWGASAAP